jgi:hypothetical protein
VLGCGYKVITEFTKNQSDLEQQLMIAKKNGSRFLFTGGVTEWRYKTGIGTGSVDFDVI